MRQRAGGVSRRLGDRGHSVAETRPVRRTVSIRRDLVGSDRKGRMLIRAVVHARLLGLRLLTLDARVVVAEAEPRDLDWHPLPVDTETYAFDSRHQPALGDVDTARALLAESAEALWPTRPRG
jgi:hypothetical protein